MYGREGLDKIDPRTTDNNIHVLFNSKEQQQQHQRRHGSTLHADDVFTNKTARFLSGRKAITSDLSDKERIHKHIAGLITTMEGNFQI